MLNSTFLGFSHNFIPCFVFSLLSPRFVSLMFRFSRWHLFLYLAGAGDGQSRYDSFLACGCEHVGHVSRDEALQIILSSPCLYLPPAEGMASFRKDSVLSPEFATVETPEALEMPDATLMTLEKSVVLLCLTTCGFLRQTFNASLSLEDLSVA